LLANNFRVRAAITKNDHFAHHGAEVSRLLQRRAAFAAAQLVNQQSAALSFFQFSLRSLSREYRKG
jgi:hypothetical protein